MREIITIQESRSATTATYFTDGFLNINTPTEIHQSFLVMNSLGQPLRVVNYDGNEIWLRNSNNNYENYPQGSNQIFTGFSYQVSFNHVLSDIERNNYSRKFQNRYQDYSQSTIQALSTNPNFTKPNQVSYVFFDDTLIDDYYANLTIHRTFSTLDTLNIYNNAINSIPNQQSDTGLLFGKLEAVQVLKDVNGNNLRIPLRNVPIGIFNSSSEFPTSTSQDDNGDRIFLNLKESSDPSEYINIQSYNTDNLYLRSSPLLSGIPTQYKYVTKTNENGEYVIHNAPVGSNIVVYEVDLLKQGLTKDEVALNFGTYDPDLSCSIDNVPHFFFRQVPVDILPSWGNFQTGYTQLDIKVNLDLRKWSTYFIAPMAAQKSLIGTDGKKVDDLIGSGNLKPYTVDIRDMSRQGYPKNTISVVEVQDMTSRIQEQYLEWEPEFAQIKSKATFATHGFHAFKVPANLYDMDGLKTLGNGSATNSKGVWLSAYQFKVSFVDSSVFRATGFHRLSGGFTRNHHDLNTNITNSTLSNFDCTSSGIGIFPYEKPWSCDYPSRYSIPSIPSIINTAKTYSIQSYNPGQPTILDEPKYLDGDLVGFQANQISGGWGIMKYIPSNLYIPTKFSERVTRNLVYKYESGATYPDNYSNGYAAGQLSFGQKISNVLSGETWQRVECGHAYYLHPEGWPTIQNNTWGDNMYSPDISPTNPNIVNFDYKDVALVMDNTAPIKEGCLSIYRVVDASPQNILNSDDIVIPTSSRFIFERVYRIQGKATNDKMNLAYGVVDQQTGQVRSNNDQRLLIYGTSRITSNSSKGFGAFQLRITNMGVISVPNPIDPSQDIEIGDTAIIDSANIIDLNFEIDNDNQATPSNAFSITLNGNSGFDFSTNKYTLSNYSFEFVYDNSIFGNFYSTNFSPITQIITTNLEATEQTKNWFFNSSYGYSQIAANSNDMEQGNYAAGQQIRDVEIRGLILGVSANSQSYFLNSRWTAAPLNIPIKPGTVSTVAGIGRMDTNIGNDEMSTGWLIL